VIDFEGKVVWGKNKPTSEYHMHLAALKARQVIQGVIHTHSRFAIAMACVHQSLPAITVDMAAYCGKEAPVVPYLTPGTERLAAVVAEKIKEGYRAMLLANHGTLFVSPDLDLLIEGAEALELAAMAYIRGSTLDVPQPIPETEVDILLDLVYGQQKAV
jgi:L-fuculose-phosphate aldolase